MTAADYFALRRHLDTFESHRDGPTHWPHVPITWTGDQLASFTAGGRGDDSAIAARVEWWSALTAPRREAEPDEDADDELVLSLLVLHCGAVCGWHRFRIEGIWDRLGADGKWSCEDLTTRQLRARLAFDSATSTEVEEVQQADPARGIEPCGCRGKDARCKWCEGTGRVRDGRRENNRHSEWYEQGDPTSPSVQMFREQGGLLDWPLIESSENESMLTAASELAHRRDQPDAFGHPYSMPLSPRPELSNRRGRLLPTRLRYGTLARAPLGETLHLTPSAGATSSARMPPAYAHDVTSDDPSQYSSEPLAVSRAMMMRASTAM